MKKYTDYKEDCSDVKWTKFKIVVPTQEDRQEVMEAMSHIHDADIDTDFVTVNQLCHEYRPLNHLWEDGTVCEVDADPKHYNIVVDKELYEKLNEEK